MADRSSFTGGSRTAGYRPAAIGRLATKWAVHGDFDWADLDLMRIDPRVSFGLRILYSPLTRVKWKVTGDARVAPFMDAQLRRFWATSLSTAFLHVVYGACGAEPLYDESDRDGLITFDALKEFHPRDCRPLVGRESGKVLGLAVRGSGGGVARMRSPNSFWLSNEPRFGSPYGVSRMREAWTPWIEKTARHGSKDVRRHWFLKNAFRGAMMRHPGGVIEIEAGRFVSCQDYAREIVEKYEAGGVITLPSAVDEKGNPLWDWEDPAPLGELPGVREWIQDQDDEIFQAMGIPKEVVEAAESGSGWAGRSVPFLIWLGGEDLIVQQTVRGFRSQIGDPLAEVNFGAGACDAYEIEVESLVPEEMQEKAARGGMGGEAEPPKGDGGPGQGPPAPTPPGPVGLSLEGGTVLLSGDWEPYEGPRGGKGWKNSKTGRVLYAARLSHEAARAPAGGAAVGGKAYRGGEFIPGEVMAKATARERAAVEGGGGGGRKGRAAHEAARAEWQAEVERLGEEYEAEYEAWEGETARIAEEHDRALAAHGARRAAREARRKAIDEAEPERVSLVGGFSGTAGDMASVKKIADAYRAAADAAGAPRLAALAGRLEKSAAALAPKLERLTRRAEGLRAEHERILAAEPEEFDEPEPDEPEDVEGGPEYEALEKAEEEYTRAAAESERLYGEGRAEVDAWVKAGRQEPKPPAVQALADANRIAREAKAAKDRAEADYAPIREARLAGWQADHDAWEKRAEEADAARGKWVDDEADADAAADEAEEALADAEGDAGARLDEIEDRLGEAWADARAAAEEAIDEEEADDEEPDEPEYPDEPEEPEYPDEPEEPEDEDEEVDGGDDGEGDGDDDEGDA